MSTYWKIKIPVLLSISRSLFNYFLRLFLPPTIYPLPKITMTTTLIIMIMINSNESLEKTWWRCRMSLENELKESKSDGLLIEREMGNDCTKHCENCKQLIMYYWEDVRDFGLAKDRDADKHILRTQLAEAILSNRWWSCRHPVPNQVVFSHSCMDKLPLFVG